MNNNLPRMPAAPAAAPDFAHDARGVHGTGGQGALGTHPQGALGIHPHDDALPLRAGVASIYAASVPPAGLPGTSAARTRGAARGALSQAAGRVWEALARDVRHPVSSDADDAEEGPAPAATEPEAACDAAAVDGRRHTAASPAVTPRMFDAARDHRAAAAVVATLQGSGKRQRDAENGNAGVVMVSAGGATRGKRGGSAVSDSGDVQRLATLAPIEPISPTHATRRRGRDKAAGSLQALRWGMGVVVAVLAACVVWLLIGPHESEGEQGGHGDAPQHCDGTSSSCAK